MVARGAIGFRAGYHRIKDKYGIKQKLTLNNKYISFCQSLTYTHCFKIYMILLKAELRISDFQYSHWFAGHRLSAHVVLPALRYMVNKRNIK